VVRVLLSRCSAPSALLAAALLVVVFLFVGCSGSVTSVRHAGEVKASATVAFEHAITASYPRGKALPYLAECAFDQRDFGAVRELLSKLGASPHDSATLRSIFDLRVGGEPERAPATGRR